MSSGRRHRHMLRALVCAPALCLLLFAVEALAAFTPPAELVVVTDDNYPPYLFHAEDGQLQGLLKDKWVLWSQKTGVPIRVEGMAWSKAQESVLSKKADVIEALARTEARTQFYEFSPPYAPVEARIFFHRSISGINEVSTLRGFTIGAKEGSACANWLTERGVSSIRAYPSSEALVQAAGAAEVRLFCMDDPTAKYLLFKHHLADNFRETAPLYAASFHWAVIKGQAELRDFIQRGFERIPVSELDSVNARWLGNPLKLPMESRHLTYFLILIAAACTAVILLLLWNSALRSRVGAKTAELRNALVSLQAHADKVQDLYNNAPCGYHSLDLDGVFVEINDTELKWLGCTRDEVIGKLSIMDFLDEDGRRRFRDEFHEFSNQDSMRDLEYELVRRDSSKLSVLISATKVRDRHGQFVMTRSTVYDISGRKRAELALRATLDQTPNVAVQWFNREGRVLYWNPASEKLYGIGGGDAVGRKMGELIHTPEQYREFLDLLKEIERTGKPCGPGEIVIRGRHGVEVTVMYTIFTIPGEGGEPIFVCMDVDITELKVSERERERLNTILKRVTEAVPLCLSYLDADHRYVWTNAQNGERLGYAPEWIIGKTSREVYGERFSPDIEAATSLLREGKTVRGEREWRNASGVSRIYDRTLVPDFGADGIYRGRTSMWLDITERTAADRERERLNVVLRRVTDAVPVCLSYIDAENRYVWTNTRNSERLGAVPEQMIGRTVREVHSQHRAELRGMMDAAVRQRKPMHDEQEWQSPGPGGELRVYERLMVPDFDPDGAHRGITSLWLDITERKESERKIRRLNRVYAVLSNINAALMRITNKQELFDEACRITVEHGQFGVVWVGQVDPATQYVNLMAWAGSDTEELREFKSSAHHDVLSSTGTLIPAIRDKRPVFDNDMAATAPQKGTRRWRAVQLGYRSVIVLPLLVKGEVAGILAMLAKEPNFFTDEEVKLLTELAGDVAFAMEVIDKERQINYLAYYDSLTGLPNRSLLHERLEHQMNMAKQNGTKVALFMADLRRFRFINQSLGRPSGDALLRELSMRLKSAWPDPDSVGRIAGDRFAAVLAEVRNETELVHLAEKFIIDSLKSPFRIDGHELVVSMTAGIAVYPEDGATADMLIQNAEAAIKQAKTSGDRYLFYQSQMNARVAETLRLENKMRRALAKEEFVLHYQPKIDLASGRIIGFEALIRWNDPEVGMVPPSQFIPILEETGMIVEAGQWAIRRVLSDYCAWESSGLQPPRVAVNVSAIQLRSKDFVDVVRSVMNEFAPNCHGLDLEITESLLMEDIEGSTEKLRVIRGMGINIAIDDFGTGYSSLAYLTKLPINALKIDRSFIDDMARNPDSMNIVSSIISLAHSLNFKVIAEGVELEEQVSVLRSMSCDEIQGYLVSRPIPAEDVRQMLYAREGMAMNLKEATGDNRAAAISTN